MRQMNVPEPLAELAIWMKDSVVRDESTKPLCVYHGTGAPFDRLRPGEDGMIFFTRSPEIAAQYACATYDLEVLTNPRIIPAFLRIRRARVLSPAEWLMGTDASGQPIGDALWHRQRKFDGIVIRADPEHPDPLFHADSFAVFCERQVRYAICP